MTVSGYAIGIDKQFKDRHQLNLDEVRYSPYPDSISSCIRRRNLRTDGAIEHGGRLNESRCARAPPWRTSRERKHPGQQNARQPDAGFGHGRSWSDAGRRGRGKRLAEAVC